MFRLKKEKKILTAEEREEIIRKVENYIGNQMKNYKIEERWIEDFNIEEKIELIKILDKESTIVATAHERYPALFFGKLIHIMVHQDVEIDFIKKIIRKTYDIWDDRIYLEEMHLLLSGWIGDMSSYLDKHGNDIEISEYIEEWAKMLVFISEDVANIMLTRDRIYEKRISDINFWRKKIISKEMLKLHIEHMENVKKNGIVVENIGYKKLIEIEEKNKNYDIVIKLIEKYIKEGWRWDGDWREYIQKLEKLKRG